MAHKDGEVMDGRDLMLYINTGGSGGNPTWEAQALATNHTITYSTETKERLTKDSPGGNPEKRITKVTVSIKADALRAFGDTAKKYLLAAMKAKSLVKLKYGFAQEETGDDYEEGEFAIDSLEETSQAGEDVTYSAQFSSSGEVVTKQKTA
ncbi:phage tail tube protein [Parabacteroides gordonii]|jgi:TP901-1 family phage major tail protein|uniref:phage tail tube protein n=1 Tax=Parabacteroides gordonii TaxID=574930 RepID=UPI000EE5B84C|nr:phage tail tube protein [Parabacteroides gordonii]RGP09268.1 hypothetical protein DXB27_23635 [Parabacteroides gordonii]